MNIAVSLKDIVMDYGGKPVFDGFSIDFIAEEIVCILGPSGCGKSTLLQAISGFRQPHSGELYVNGNPAVVFQKHSLFPWKTAAENVGIGLRLSGMSKHAAISEAKESLLRVGLEDRADSYPGELSLGQQQRVGIARAFSQKSPVLLMDEPFGALDAQTRLRMQTLLLEIWGATKPTIIFVTHDIDEALLLGDRVLVLKGVPARVCADLRVKATKPRRFSDLVTPELAELRQNIFEML